MDRSLNVAHNLSRQLAEDMLNIRLLANRRAADDDAARAHPVAHRDTTDRHAHAHPVRAALQIVRRRPALELRELGLKADRLAKRIEEPLHRREDRRRRPRCDDVIRNAPRTAANDAELEIERNELRTDGYAKG